MTSGCTDPAASCWIPEAMLSNGVYWTSTPYFFPKSFRSFFQK
jgi:hypothetical protein